MSARHAWLRSLVGAAVLSSCTVAVPAPPHVPPPVAPAPVEPPSCTRREPCGSGCVSVGQPIDLECFRQLRVPTNEPRWGEHVVDETDLPCRVDRDCAVAQAGGCPCPECPRVHRVGDRIPRPRTCHAKVSCTPCATPPTHARCQASRCVGVVSALFETW